MPHPAQTTLNDIADLHKKLAANYEALGPFLATPADAATSTSSVSADPPPAKRGRPAKVETASTPASPVLISKEEPKVDDTKVTADHPERLALKKVANELIAASDKATAQSAVKLFGENTNLIVDVQLGAAVAHLTALLKKKQTNNDDV